MNYQKKILILFLIFLLPITTYASNVIVKASIDSVHVLIGNQANLKLSVIKDKADKVDFPLLRDSISNGLEIVEQKKADTTLIGNNRIQINQNYLIAAYDSGLYYIPSFKFNVINQGTLETNPLTIKVLSPAVDTVKAETKDIKPILYPPFSWKYFLKNLLIILLIIALIAAIVYVVWRLIKNKPIVDISKPTVEIPPHIIALNELEKIKDEKLWQKGREKDFHTQITDVLRVYIENRFSISAMEMTSDEILNKINRYNDSKSVLESLKQILKTADLVKFAKMKLEPNENELSIINSYLFINQTKIEEIIEIPSPKKEDENTLS